DVALAAAICAELTVELLITDQRSGPLALNLVLALAMGAPLALRRVQPLATVAGSGVAIVLMAATATRPQNLVGTFAVGGLATFSVAAHERRGRALVGLGAILAIVIVASVITDDLAVVFPFVVFGGLWVLGRIARGRARLTRELAAQARQLERERVERERD